MITLLFTLASIALAQHCPNIDGFYDVTDGRGRFVQMTAQVTQTECSFVVVLGTEEHLGSIQGNELQSDDGEHSGQLESDGKILWNNGFCWWPQNLPKELLPMECLHPFALYCYQECNECAPCIDFDAEINDWDTDDIVWANGRDPKIFCEECGRCEMCLDYEPCLSPVQHHPECVEPESLECLRECRECTHCAEFDDCMDVTSQVDEFCLTTETANCLDTCEQCLPCALGEASCDGCEQCERCIPYVDCMQQTTFFPAEKRKCISSDAIHCFNDCSHCSSAESECLDRMYCLDAFTIETEPPVMPPMNGDKSIYIEGYPCATHGQGMETLNQRYVFLRMANNGHEIFQGEMYPQWFIYFDANCGGDHSHPPAWYLSNQRPSFEAEENLGGHIGQCRNTMRIEEQQQFPFHREVDRFGCDNGPTVDWGNDFMDRGFKVSVEFRNENHMCCRAYSLECVACSAGMSPDEFCMFSPHHELCRDQCNDDEHRLREDVHAMGNPGLSQEDWNDFLETVDEMGCRFAHEPQHHDKCRFVSACGCSCPDMPPMPEQYCEKNEDCLYETCENAVCSDRGVCMKTDAAGTESMCPPIPALPRMEFEFCAQHSDCQYESCAMPGLTVSGHCSGADDDSRDCSKGDCVCTNGNYDAYCDDKPDNFRLMDGSWCQQTASGAIRGMHCPRNPGRENCVRVTNGNYEVHDISIGEVDTHMKMQLFDGRQCHGEAFMANGDYITFESFASVITARSQHDETEVFYGVPNEFGGFVWNGIYSSKPIECMFIYSGTYSLMGPHDDGSFGYVLTHYMHQGVSEYADGCAAVTRSDDGAEYRLQLTSDTISGMIGDQMVTGRLMENSMSIAWDNGYESHPVFEEEEHHCEEDRDRFLDVVRRSVTTMENPRINEFIQHVAMEGCNALRHNPEAKFQWCTFSHDARDACSCVCDEFLRPKPVCRRDQFRAFLHLSGDACTDLFVSGLAEEHRDVCDCLRSVPENVALELFGSECFFSEWSDRSFMQRWRDCQWH